MSRSRATPAETVTNGPSLKFLALGSAYVGSNPSPATTCGNGPLAGNSRLGGPFFSVAACVTLWRCGPLCCGVHGRIADGFGVGRTVYPLGFTRTVTDGPRWRRVLA